ncbi:MAG: flagellar basal body rod protein FlgB [Candidatus Krumholzibacteriota bacterium]|nr:flagellar basal body rod protein FlgB [Candidatus Krumholzibacteriota bacterium]
MAKGIFNDLDLLKRSLDAYALRQRVIAENIAHVETPGYRARSVAFEELLRAAAGDEDGAPLRRSQAGHMPAPGAALPAARVQETAERALDNGTNDVNLDLEMAALAETSLRHKMASRILALRFQGIRSAIRGRGGA